jgi:hypothetical protein
VRASCRWPSGLPPRRSERRCVPAQSPAARVAAARIARSRRLHAGFRNPATMPGRRPVASPHPICHEFMISRHDPAKQQPWAADQIARSPSHDETITAPQPRAVESTLSACVPSIQVWQIRRDMTCEMTDNYGGVIDDPHAGAQRAVGPLVVLAGAGERRVLVEPAGTAITCSGNAIFGGKSTSPVSSGLV